MAEDREPRWIDHLGDRADTVAEPDPEEIEAAGPSRVEVTFAFAIPTALLITAMLLRPSWLAAVLFAAVITWLYRDAWETMQESRDGEA